MAGINIGPWGKDFHKLTERVYKEDLYERTPADPGRGHGLQRPEGAIAPAGWGRCEGLKRMQ